MSGRCITLDNDLMIDVLLFKKDDLIKELKSDER